MNRPGTRNAIIVLAVLAAVSWLGARRGPEQRPEPIDDLDPRLNYALWDFHALMLDDTGNIKIELQAPMLRNNANTGIGSVENPRIRVQQDGEEWYITADSAIVTADREHVSLVGTVNLAHNDTASSRSMEIQTRDVLLNVTPRTAETEARVNIVQDGDELQARGMKLDMKTSSYELLSEVSGRYATP